MGPIGPAGPAGPAGSIGAKGEQGSPGLRGEKGDAMFNDTLFEEKLKSNQEAIINLIMGPVSCPYL